MRILALSLIVLCLPIPALAEQVRVLIYPVIRLDAEPSAQGKHSVRLASLARIVADRDTARALQSLQVPTGKFRGSTRIDGQLMKDVIAALPELAAAEILAPERINVAAALAPERLQLAVNEAEQALRQHIADRWPGRYRNVELRHVSGQRQTGLGPADSYRFDFSDLVELRSRTPIWLVVDNAAGSRRMPLWFDVTGEQLVWEAVDELDARDLAKDDEFIQRWRSMAEIRGGRLAEPDSDKRTVAAMAAGEILTDQHLEPVPDIDYGADVRVISRVGDVQIETVARALETAYAGDLVSLRSKSSDEQFEARVMEQNLALIENSSAGKDEALQLGE